MKGSVLALVCCVLVFYVILSGLIFHLLEFKNETVNRNDVLNATRLFLLKYPDIDPVDLEEYALEVIDAYEEGAIVVNNGSASPSNWDIPSSIFFATTVVTTIGYGHIAPDTSSAQIYCVFFTITGIPICVLALTGIGCRLKAIKNKISSKCMAWFCPGESRTAAAIRSILLELVASVVFVFLPAVIFRHIEGWSYQECLYYVVITLSTVGFGDYVASIAQEPGTLKTVYKTCFCLYIAFGLAWLSSVLSAIKDALETTSDRVTKVKIIKRKKTSRVAPLVTKTIDGDDDENSMDDEIIWYEIEPGVKAFTVTL